MMPRPLAGLLPPGPYTCLAGMDVTALEFDASAAHAAKIGRASRVTRFARAWVFGAAVALGACANEPASTGSTGTGAGGGGPKVVDLSFCDDVITMKSGRLCAIQPSKTDPAITDANGTGPGLGYHMVGFPADFDHVRGVWVHFVGSYGRPYNQKDGTASSKAWLDEAIAKNYLVIVVAYENSKSINGDICTCANGANGCNVDDCAGQVRREILEGVDHSSLVSVSVADGVDNRLKKLAGYLKSKSVALPQGFDDAAIDWSKLMVSGHSQGAGHAYYLAKNTGVKGACFFSGPFDTADMVDASAPIADWYLPPGSLTDPSVMGGVVASTDPNAKSFIGALNSYIGLVQNQQWFEYPMDANSKLTDYDGNALDPTNPNDAHGSTVGAMELSTLRAQACFGSAAHIE